MTDVDHRQAAIDAAAEIHHDLWCRCGGDHDGPSAEDITTAQRMLDAAAPHLAAGVYEQIAELAERYNAMHAVACLREDCRNATHYVHFAKLIRVEALAAKLTALGVPPGEQAMYAHAIQQDPDWRERLPAVTTRA